MRKLLFGAALFIFCKAPAQTLLSIGNDSVTVQEFVEAFKKNNTAENGPAALQDYLDLYIASKLKIKEALNRGYDTLPQFKLEMANLRNQILPAYERDEQTVQNLLNEAFNRSQKDIRVAHIYISNSNANSILDTAAASRKAQEAYRQVKQNISFADVARKYSDDPTAKQNGGDLGYITVFSLPYELENLAYNTPVGSISSLHRSNVGFHIFKVIAARPASGRVKAAQILIAFPPESTAAQKKQLKYKADSLYGRLTKGGDFGKLAQEFSNDYISAQANGTIPEFGVGEYDSQFESVVFSLRNGAISKPFETAHGYHIVKRLGSVPINKDRKNAAAMQALKEKLESSDRIGLSTEVLTRKIKDAELKHLPFEQKELWAFSDSVIDGKKPKNITSISYSTPLLKIGREVITSSDWISYAQNFRYKPDGSGLKPYAALWEEFVDASVLEHYKENLEHYNPDFKKQVQEFKEGNLFFEIMQKEVWGPAQSDTVAIKTFYEQHKNNYKWGASADAVIFYITDPKLVTGLSQELKKSPASWKQFAENLNDKVTTDSGRFELSQIPNGEKAPLKAGTITTPLVNAGDNTASFALIQKLYTQPERRRYEDAKALVINDYQAELEKRWVMELKRKYPVTLNKAAWAALTNMARK
ncbi:MAG TPA: peptidylprolyl isomerase [Chitinophagaceae bacterium]|nr:peptidylprolyl isomerase [Chitinophagaceae bacterium]